MTILLFLCLPNTALAFQLTTAAVPPVSTVALVSRAQEVTSVTAPTAYPSHTVSVSYNDRLCTLVFISDVPYAIKYYEIQHLDMCLHDGINSSKL